MSENLGDLRLVGEVGDWSGPQSGSSEGSIVRGRKGGGQGERVCPEPASRDSGIQVQIREVSHPG